MGNIPAIAIQVGQALVAMLGNLNWAQIIGSQFAGIAASVVGFIEALLGFAATKVPAVSVAA